MKPAQCIATAALLLFAACAPHETADWPTVSIMTFNVENLFDTADDPAKDDRDYLPLEAKQTDAHRAGCATLRFESWRDRCLNIDWNETVLERKLSVVAASILQVNDGRGPDVVALQEIENIGILERLRSGYLAAAGYLPGILVEGNDSRGIDVAFLSRLPTTGRPALHPIEFPAEYGEAAGDTRGILQADFLLPDGTVLTGFSVHFPAPYHPTGMRIAAYETLNRLLDRLPDGRPAFAAGDFNTTSAEDGAEQLLDRYARPRWAVSNDLCDGCPGTSYYARDDTWSFLDMILWRECCGADATWSIRADSVRIANAEIEQMHSDGTPKRFALPEGGGVSDHWPVVIELERK